MKRIFPVIILLITLSLLGTILIQVSWFRSMIENKQEYLGRTVAKSVEEVGTELMQEKGTLPPLKNLRVRPRLNWQPSDQMQMELRNPTTIAEKYTAFEIKERIQKVFNRNGLENTGFEFALTSNVNLFTYETRSENFLNLLDTGDSSKTRTFVYLFQDPTASEFENLMRGETLTVIVPNLPQLAFIQLRWMMLGAILFSLIILAAFYITIRTLLRQKKLSAMKNDFINNMTHEFKTPISTISLAIDMLKNEKVLDSRDKTDYFTSIIKDENKRMNKQVETILQAAITDRKDLKLELKPISVHEVLRTVMENFHLQLEEIKGKLTMQLNAKLDSINADEVHFTNIITNLVDNAIKYSKKNKNLHLRISTANADDKLIITLQDNGIGMSKDTLKHIFEKFYRAHTGNRHDVKGFGLGLSYVKAIVSAHQGKIKVDSVVDKGTTFMIELPLVTVAQAG